MMNRYFISRRFGLRMLLAAGLLAGCGSTETTAPRPPLSARPTAGQPTNTAAQPAVSPSPFSVALEPLADGFSRPVYVTHAGDQRLFVVEQAGTIKLLPSGEPFLDIRERVGSDGNEQGLLGLAFHPQFAANGWFYVNYTDRNGDTVIARYAVTGDGQRGDPASEQVVLKQAQPAANHNGGMLAFGPDGLLYIGLGDGGGANDTYQNAQNLNTLLGKILRIDVDAAQPYAAPADNPFAANPAARPEIWAYGLRNPWRFSFDRATGDLYIGDVGQNRYEWLHWQPAGAKGGQNYGWPIVEGSHCLRGDSCDTSGLTLPIIEYDHDLGCVITGGYVYRGAAYPFMQGAYLFADYCSGRMWSLSRAADGAWTQHDLLDSGLSISSFGEDAAGELYVVDLGGTVYRLTAQSR